MSELGENLLPSQEHEMSDFHTLGTFGRMKQEKKNRQSVMIVIIGTITLVAVFAGGFLAGHYSTSLWNNCPKKEKNSQGTPAPTSEPPRFNSFPGEPDQLFAANDAFKHVYARQLDIQITTNLLDGPVFWGHYNQTHLGLLWKGEMEFKEGTPPAYTILKDVCHQALGAYLLFNSVTDTPLNKSFMADVARFLNLVTEANRMLPTLNSINSTQIARQLSMSNGVINFLKSVQNRNPPNVSRAELDQFAHSMQERILLNVQDATNALVKRWLEIVTEWRKQFDKETWAKAKAFAPTSAMARESLTKLFFVGVLGASGNNGDRVFPVVVTNGVDLDVLKRISATYLQDLDLGRAFLDNPNTMTYDLLHNSTVKRMQELKANNEVPIRPPLFSKRSARCPFH